VAVGRLRELRELTLGGLASVALLEPHGAGTQVEAASPGNGDGQWPKPGNPAVPSLAPSVLSLITAGQRDADVFDTSRCACRKLAPERRHITWLVT
jgi:hypothetical protein